MLAITLYELLWAGVFSAGPVSLSLSVLPDGLSVGNCRYGRIVTNQRSSPEALTLGEGRVAPPVRICCGKVEFEVEY